ncbi:MAG: methionyl-tRNA formyltransferase [Betaproteobacteria bacterium]|nr:methionyl-tRNA formyltransferase [Betaproteobacteria bacterium]
MRLVFAGTPRFAADALEAILAAGHDVALVLTQPDRPSGRGMKLTPSEVKRVARTHALPVWQPSSLKGDDAVGVLRETNARIMVVAAYGLILPAAVLDAFPLGCVNIHASLLPRWRGAAPIQRAILAGDDRTGITIMRMDAGLDTGQMLLEEAIPIAGDDTAGSLHDRLSALGAGMIVNALGILEARTLPGREQDESAATYAAKVSKAEAEIDWRNPAGEIERRIRAFNPVPGAYSVVRGDTVKIWRSRVVSSGGAAADVPGEIVRCSPSGVAVACGGGTVLELTELQRSGGKRLDAERFLAGFPLRAGERFSSTGD